MCQAVVKPAQNVNIITRQYYLSPTNLNWRINENWNFAERLSREGLIANFIIILIDWRWLKGGLCAP